MTSVWYHGTNESSASDICKNGIDFVKSLPELDFGAGFYMTDDETIAKRRAWNKTKMFNRINKCNESPAIVTLIIDERYFPKFNKKVFEYCNDEWLHFVLANRLPKIYLEKNLIDEHNLDLRYDLVIGSIADSNISTLIDNLVKDNIKFTSVSVYDILTEEGRSLGQQMSLHTLKSLQCIKSMSYDVIVERRNNL